jgi:hypothetical protein
MNSFLIIGMSVIFPKTYLKKFNLILKYTILNIKYHTHRSFFFYNLSVETDIVA